MPEALLSMDVRNADFLGGRTKKGRPTCLAFPEMALKVVSGFLGHCLSDRETDHGEKRGSEKPERAGLRCRRRAQAIAEFIGTIFRLKLDREIGKSQ